MGLLDRIKNIPNSPLAMAGLGLLSMPTRSRHPINPMEYAMHGMQAGVQNQQMQQEMAARAEEEKQRKAEYQLRIAEYGRKAMAENEAAVLKKRQDDLWQAQLEKMSPADRIIAEMVGPSVFGKSKLDAMKPDKGTATQQNYEQAKADGYKGSFYQYQVDMANARRPTSTVNVNTGGPFKIPGGFMMGPDGQSVVPIPGGPNDPNTPKPPSAEIQRSNIAIGALEQGINEYEKLLEGFDPRNPVDQFSPQKTAQIASLVADLRMQMKEAQMLGALTGPDVEILEKLLSDPATMRGAWYGKGGLRKQIDETRKAISRRQTSTNQITGRDMQIVPGAAPGIGNNGWSIRKK